MKIVIVSLNGMDDSGGVERVTYYLQKTLTPYYSIRILTKLKCSFGKLNTLIQTILIALRLALIRNKIVISNSWHSFFFPADFSIHHGTTKGMMLSIPETKSIANVIISFMEKSSCVFSKKILAVSSQTRDELINLYNVDKKKIIVLNNFVDENIFFPPALPARENNSVITILFSGRLEIRKGLDSLKILSDAIELRDGYKLNIACNNSANVDLFAHNKKTSIFAGLPVGEMRAFYNRGDILFFPTLYEGFSMAALEALSCGIPVIGTEYAVKEELRGYDFTKICNHFDNPEELFTQIDILVKKYGSKKQEIHETVKKDFGYGQYEHKLLSLIEAGK